MRKILPVVMMVLFAALCFSSCSDRVSEESNGFSVGSWDKNTYINTWADIRFELPEDWSFIEPVHTPSYGTKDYFFGTDAELSENGFTDYCNLNGFYAKGSDNFPNISLYFLNNLHKYNKYESAQAFVDNVMEALFSYYNNDVVTLEEGEIDIAGTSYYYSLGNHGGEDQNYYFAYYAAIKGDIVIVWAVNATQDNFWMADNLIRNAVTTV